MRIAIVTTQCPFVVGGAELHAQNLMRNLIIEGHEAEIVSIPFKWYPSVAVLDAMLAAKSLDISEFNGVKIDLAICLKFPAYLIRHPNKVYWVLHQHRQSYDLWDSGQSDLFNDSDGKLVREAVIAADNAELRGKSNIFANSENVAKRLLKYNGVHAEALYHPPPLASSLRPGTFGDYFYYPSRITPPKRHDFVIKSLARTKSKSVVVFSGAADNDEYEQTLRKLAYDLGVSDRIVWKGFVTDAENVELYEGARGVLFTPVDEDLGYVALEAMCAGKPLLTLSDAGEPASLIRDHKEGRVCPPDPDQFAGLIDDLSRSLALAQTLGQKALLRYRSMDLSWAKVVSRLTDRPTGRPRHSLGLPSPNTAFSEQLGSDRGEGSFAEASWVEKAQAPGFMSLDELGSLYDLDDHLSAHRGYYETHWPRFHATVACLRSIGPPQKILELGTASPYLFTALLKESFPQSEFFAIQEKPEGARWTHIIPAKNSSRDPITVQVLGLNMEVQRIPLEDGQFDLVLAMEALEHFALDPSFVFRQAERLLRRDGRFLVTTPNLISIQGIARAIEGWSPYSFGVFVPWHGVYGRHNREYTPNEVESLGKFCGLETDVLDTADVYKQNIPPEALKSFMHEHGYPLTHRGQNIFYLGRKPGVPVRSGYPEALFPVDPRIFEGRLEIVSASRETAHYFLRIFNKSACSWSKDGESSVRISIDRIDQNGFKEFDVASVPLPHDLEPDQSTEIPFFVTEQRDGKGFWFEISLFLQSAGSFKEVGRTKSARIFADAISF